MPFIITENCTGCTACIKRCPTDAITGASASSSTSSTRSSASTAAPAALVTAPDEAIYDDEGNLCEDASSPRRSPKAYVDLQSRVRPGCEWCVWACPFDALEMGSLKSSHHFKVAEVIVKKCVGCTLCELDCPYDAIHIFHALTRPKAEVQNERNARYEEEIGARAEPAAAPGEDEKAA